MQPTATSRRQQLSQRKHTQHIATTVQGPLAIPARAMVMQYSPPALAYTRNSSDRQCSHEQS
eukprot:11197583-Lingulodinium_polyedra.AAC.1